ncbi:wiskott-Aldrich syndrome protein homolog 1-like [Neltuma alba]|uniref:wiskott-Aldrich syndrome protein homolog 1-like n=1 Tax=Neltuma alba TaxID=207710 RepID=UPI0010A59E71|nr:wiskott-Aldrich syndrome protein homolog 1-like [Prosopis alba]
MEKMRRSSPAASLFIFTLIIALISRNLVIPVISSTNIEDPHAGSPPSVPSYSSPPPPGCSGGGYNPTPPMPSGGNGGSLPHRPSPTPSNPPSSSPSSYGDGRPQATPTDPGTPTVPSLPSCLPFPSPFIGTCRYNFNALASLFFSSPTVLVHLSPSSNVK